MLLHAFSIASRSVRKSSGKTGRSKYVFPKTDVKSAFRLVPLKKRCWSLLVFKARDPDSNIYKFFCGQMSSVRCQHFLFSFLEIF